MAKKTAKRVLLTRENNNALASLLKERGVDVLDIPMIKIELGCNAEDRAEIFNEMGRYDWITFSSVNGVRGFFSEFFKEFKDIRNMGFARIACVGEGTAAELRKYYLEPAVVPETSSGAAMADAMSQFETLDNLKVLCVRGTLSLPELPRKLEDEFRAIVDVFEVYKTGMLEISKEDGADFRKGGAHAVVFSSPSAVESFARNAPHLLLSEKAVRPKIVTIGATTSAAVKKFGMKVSAEADAANLESVAKAVFDALENI